MLKLLGYLVLMLRLVAPLSIPQQPLSATRNYAKGENWTVVEMGDEVCRSPSRQFSGSVNVTTSKSLFFWFIESEIDPNNRPVLLWLSGGPGASSLTGLFGEIGPCIINKHGNDTEENEYSWTKDFNVLFLDQPAGVGFSWIREASLYPSTVEESSHDFSQFLNIFFGDIFPQFTKDGLYIAGESFGGKYVPVYTSDILKAQELQSVTSPPVHIKGVVLVNALVEFSSITTSHYDMFCIPGASPVSFNETACEAIANAVPECESLGDLCLQNLDAYACQAAFKYCDANIGKYLQAEVEANRVNPYDLRLDCPNPPVCSSSSQPLGSVQLYMNQEHVQDALMLKDHIKYKSINFELNEIWDQQPGTYVPTTREISMILDYPGVELLVLNGNYDGTVNTPGTLRLFDHIKWSKQAIYRSQELKSWFWTEKDGQQYTGGKFKVVPGLSLVTVDNAGHMCPAEQKGAVASVVRRWIASGTVLPI